MMRQSSIGPGRRGMTFKRKKIIRQKSVSLTFHKVSKTKLTTTCPNLLGVSSSTGLAVLFVYPGIKSACIRCCSRHYSRKVSA